MECFWAWIEDHSALSGWVQAVGSLLAIGIAIYVPYKQQKNTVQMEADRIAYTERTNLNAIIAIACQIQAIVSLIEDEGTMHGWHRANIDMSFFDISYDQLRGLPLFEIPDGDIILAVSTLPIAIKQLQLAWSEFRKNLTLSNKNPPPTTFLSLKETLKSLAIDAIDSCNAKLKTL